MYNLILLCLFCVIFGILPIYLFLNRYSLDAKFKLILALGFSPVLLAVLNVLIVLVSIENTFLKYFILIIPFLISYKSFVKIKIQLNYNLMITIGLSVLIGVIFCLFAFPNISFVAQQPYADVEFNLGLIQELKHHFLPHDPYWRTEGFMVYHFLGNIFYAGLSNFTGIDVYSTYQLGNVFLALNLFTIFGLVSNKKRVISNLVIALIFLTFSVANEWVVLSSFHRHLSYSSSTFYWSLPTFFASIYLWKHYSKKRKEISIIISIAVAWVLSFSIVFFKTTLIIPFLLLEFISFIKFIKINKIYNFKVLNYNLSNLLKFLLIPLFSITAIFIMALGSSGKLFVGVEARDFEYFYSWSILFPIVLLFLAPIILIFINYRSKIKFIGVNYLIVACVNLIMVFLILHEGFSDVYFGFNALLLILVFLLEYDTNYKLIKVGLAYGLSSLIFFFVMRPDSPADFSLNLIKDRVSDHLAQKDSVFYNNMKALELVGEQMDKNTLVMVDSIGLKDFSIPAYMGVSTWNGCNSYAHSTINSYTVPRVFLEEQKFIPSYVNGLPNMTDYKAVYDVFKASYIIDTLSYENPKVRTSIYNNVVFGDWSQVTSSLFLQKSGITHIYVKSNKIRKVNAWISNLPKIESENFTIYIITNK